MKVAIVYDRVNKWGGAERVLLALHEIFPEAPLYTSVYDRKNAPWAKVFPKIYTSFLQKVPFARHWHEGFGWLMPFVFESFQFDEYDLVISVTSEAAKGIIVKPQTAHICYMLTPTRYLWSHYNLYFKNPVLRFMAKPVVNYLRVWDKIAAQRPDEIIAISTEVQGRIRKYYGRDSNVIFPPVGDITSSRKNSLLRIFSGAYGKTSRPFLLDTKSYYLVVSRLVPYKRVDLVIKAFNQLGKRLVIVGEGSEASRLKSMAKNNIQFLGKVTDPELVKVYVNALALIMPQEEDFGLVAVEAQSFGVPVIAYKKGGVVDTVIDGVTGVFFDQQKEKSLITTIEKFEKMSFNSKLLIRNAKRFSQKSPFWAYFGRRGRNTPLAQVS